MHPLLAQALPLGAHAEGLSDQAGNRVSVERSECVIQFEIRGADGGIVATAWRCAPAPRVPPGFPHGVPFLADLSCTAVEDALGLTVNWPDPEESKPQMGAFSFPSLGGLVGGGARADPVSEAWSQFTTEGAVSNRLPQLEIAFGVILEGARGESWALESEEVLQGPLPGRIARLTNGPRRRSLTLSAGLGVASLVLLDRG